MVLSDRSIRDELVRYLGTAAQYPSSHVNRHFEDFWGEEYRSYKSICYTSVIIQLLTMDAFDTFDDIIEHYEGLEPNDYGFHDGSLQQQELAYKYKIDAAEILKEKFGDIDE